MAFPEGKNFHQKSNTSTLSGIIAYYFCFLSICSFWLQPLFVAYFPGLLYKTFQGIQRTAIKNTLAYQDYPPGICCS